MREYTTLDLISDGKGGYIEKGERIKLSASDAEVLLEKGRIEPFSGKKVEVAKPPPTIEGVYGKKMAGAMAAVGILSWLEMSFVTDQQLLSVEGITKENLKEIRKKIMKE